MGYFANGSEGLDWQEHNCVLCVHEPAEDSEHGCPVMLLHGFWNSDRHNKADPARLVKVMALDMLIPREGLGNARCAMFWAQTETE